MRINCYAYVRVSLLAKVTRQANRIFSVPYYFVVCSTSACTTFLHIISSMAERSGKNNEHEMCALSFSKTFVCHILIKLGFYQLI